MQISMDNLMAEFFSVLHLFFHQTLTDEENHLSYAIAA